MSDGIPQTLVANWKVEGLQLVRVGVGRWRCPGHGSDHTWQAQAGAECRWRIKRESVWGVEGNACTRRARVVLWASCVWDTCWGPVPLWLVRTDTPFALLTYFGHCIVRHTMTHVAFLGGHFPLGITTRNVLPWGFWWASACPWAFPSLASAGPAVTGVSSRSL